MVKGEHFAVQHFLPAERKKPRPLKNALSRPLRCGWGDLRLIRRPVSRLAANGADKVPNFE